MQFFDRIVVINLDRREDRIREFWRDLYRDWPLRQPERLRAIDGEIVPPPTGWRAGNGGWGAMSSHLRVIEQALLDNLDSLLVFEDDALPADDFTSRLQAFLADVPDDWDALWLGGQNFGPAESISEHVWRIHRPHRMHAYALRKRAMRAVYQRLVSSRDHCDHTLTRWIGRQYAIYAPKSPLFGQRGSRSDINAKMQPTQWWSFAGQEHGRPISVGEGITVVPDYTGWGEVACNGTLGYAGKVELPRNVTYDYAISAHADSEVTLKTEIPLSIRGAINLTGELWQPGQNCAFTVDWHRIGELNFSGSTTSAVELPPGEYRLRIEAHPTIDWCHTLWILARSKMPAKKRLALVTIGCYQEWELYDRTRHLQVSAADNGLHLCVFGVGEKYGTHAETKIFRLAEWINKLPESYTDVLYMDGKDTFLLGGEEEILRKFEPHRRSVLVSGEMGLGPGASLDRPNTPEWATLLAERVTVKGGLLPYPCAGAWMGSRRNASAMLTELMTINSQLAGGEPVHKLQPWSPGWCDQFALQAGMVTGRVKAVTDSAASVFFSMWAHDKTLPEMQECCRDGRLITKDGARPCAVHFNATAGIHRWWGFLRMQR